MVYENCSARFFSQQKVFAGMPNEIKKAEGKTEKKFQIANDDQLKPAG
ncbi:hypothetical protein MPQ_1761 [Methylovorus sp. MP688]|nr:hypothetical protein MPQ_1761 [Methylovorus sp. MP688]